MSKQEEIEFLKLLNKYSAIIYQISQIYGNNDPHYIHELQQEIAYALWKEFFRHGKFVHSPRYSETACITNLAISTAISYYRRYQAKFITIPLTQVMNNLQINDESSQLRERINDLIATLPIKDQRLVVYYLNQCSYAQIAQYEGMSLSAVGTRMARIFKKLKENSKQL